MHITVDTPVGQIVAADFRTAAVFHEVGIDFCCGGRRSLGEACEARNLDSSAILQALIRSRAASPPAPQFDTWFPGTLTAYIVKRHHAFVRGALPALTAHTQKLATAHGKRHPELLEVARLTAEVAAEMTSHMAKEEDALFPYIEALSDAARAGKEPPTAMFGTVENPIRMMEADHESAGAALARIRELTAGYTPPADGCTTYRICLQELEAFERDLHAHVHLENNVLFPMARRLAAGTAA